MSGGSFGYIQHKYGTDFLEDAGLLENLEAMAEQLKSYGPVGAQAAQATAQVHERVTEIRAQVAAMAEEIERAIRPLQQVWRQADYHSNLDSSEESVVEVLKDYNGEQVSA